MTHPRVGGCHGDRAVHRERDEDLVIGVHPKEVKELGLSAMSGHSKTKHQTSRRMNEAQSPNNKAPDRHTCRHRYTEAGMHTLVHGCRHRHTDTERLIDAAAQT